MLTKLVTLGSALVLIIAIAAVRRPAKAQYGYRTLPLDQVVVGKRIAPVPLDLAGKNSDTVYLGSYLVNAIGGCNDCHTNPSYAAGGNPFMGQPTQVNTAGYLAGGQLFGPFTSRNITPVNGLPAGLTLEQFLEAMTKGTDFKDAHPQLGPLLQVMPWPTYSNMTREQLTAIYAYLSAIPPLATPAPPAKTTRVR